MVEVRGRRRRSKMKPQQQQLYLYLSVLLVVFLPAGVTGGRSHEDGVPVARARGSNGPVQIPLHRVGLLAQESEEDDSVSTLRPPTPIFRNGIMTFKDTDFFQAGLPEDMTTDSEAELNYTEHSVSTHKPITTKSANSEKQDGVASDNIVVKNLPAVEGDVVEKTNFDPLTNLQDFLDLESVKDIKEDFAYDYDQLAVESESAHHNISAANLHHKTAEAGPQAAKSLEDAFETESDASDYPTGDPEDPVEFQVKKSTSSSFSQAVSKIMFTTTRDATPNLQDNSENNNHDENVATESMHAQEQQADKVTQPIQQKPLTTLPPPTTHELTDTTTSADLSRDLTAETPRDPQQLIVLEVTENARKVTHDDKYVLTPAEDSFDHFSDSNIHTEEMVTATLATNNDHEHFEHDGVTDEPLGGAIQEVSHPTPGLLNIVEVHPTEGAREVYVSERFSDYNYEELVQTETSTEYDLSLLELEELKELKASLEKKLGINSPPEIHDVFEYNPFLHSPIPTTAPIVQEESVQYDYQDPVYYQGDGNVEYEYTDSETTKTFYEYAEENQDPPLNQFTVEEQHKQELLEQQEEYEYEQLLQPHEYEQLFQQQQQQQQEQLVEEVEYVPQEQHSHEHTQEQHNHGQHSHGDDQHDHRYGEQGHQLLEEEKERLEEIFTHEQIAQLEPQLKNDITNYLEDTEAGAHAEHNHQHNNDDMPVEEKERLHHNRMFVNHLQEYGMHDEIIHAAQDHVKTEDNSHPLVVPIEKKPHYMMVKIKPKKLEPKLMIRLLYERVPHKKSAHMKHLDDPVIHKFALYRNEMDFHMKDLPMGKYIVCAEARVDEEVIQNNCFEEDIQRIDNNKLQSGVIAVISVAMFIVFCMIMYAIYYRINAIRKRRKEKEFQSKVESIASKEAQLAESEKCADSYITFSNEPYEERCIM